MKTKRKIIVTAFLASVIVALAVYLANHDNEYSLSRVEDKLKLIQNPVTEKIIFNDLWQNWRVSFSPYDVDGALLDISKPNWHNKLFKVTFHHSEKDIDYHIKDVQNIYILMRE